MESQPRTSASGRIAATVCRLALGQHGDKVRRGQVIVVSLVDAADHDFGIDARLAQEAQSGRRAGGED